MASRSLATVEKAHAQRAADTQRAAELAERYAGWVVWSARDGLMRLATRAGDNQQPPAGDDPIWSRTLIEENWNKLDVALAEQAQADQRRAARTYLS
jgi:hypothetical protein